MMSAFKLASEKGTTKKKGTSVNIGIDNIISLVQLSLPQRGMAMTETFCETG